MSPRSTNIIYENCRMFSPDGTFMAMVNRKKANYYISNNLADVVHDDEDGLYFKLRFIPKKVRQEDYCKEIKENLCVVCGATQELSRHHIVPRCYKKHLPPKYVRKMFYDTVVLCFNCHSSYEEIANLYKKDLFKLRNIDIEIPQCILNKYKVGSYARTLLIRKEVMPKEAFDSLKRIIDNYIDLNGGSCEELAANGKLQFKNECRIHIENCYKKLVDSFGAQKFIVHWRKHFVDTMKPKHMPKCWEIKKNILKKD